jgi:hypothetical protein
MSKVYSLRHENGDERGGRAEGLQEREDCLEIVWSSEALWFRLKKKLGKKNRLRIWFSRLGPKVKKFYFVS